MSWIVRIVDANKSEADHGQEASLLDSMVATTLWDLGTTGLAEVNGELLAGFDDHDLAQRAIDSLSVWGNRQATGYRLSSHPEPIPGSATGTEGASGDGWAGSRGDAVINWSRGQIRLGLDSTSVFGHGRHPTTRLVLDLMLEHLAHNPATAGPRSSPERQQKSKTSRIRLLDVGTGTGILAIAATATGLVDATAIDIDPTARATARTNAAENNVVVNVRDETIDDLVQAGSTYDLATANVLLAQHRTLNSGIMSTVVPGHIVLSGYLINQTEEVLRLYQRSAVKTTVVAASYRGEWAGHLLRIDVDR